MKKIILLFLSLYCVFQANAQLSVSYSAGYGTYKMNEMGDLLETLKNRANTNIPGLDAIIVDDFPGYIIHTLNVGYKVKNNEIGVKSSFFSTGGKVSRADYSGDYSMKVIVNGFREGLYFRNYFYRANVGKQSGLSVFGEISPSIILTTVKVKEQLNVSGNLQSLTNETVKSAGFSILPQAGAKFNFTPNIGMYVEVGYELSVPTKMTVMKLYETKADWSGFRIGSGVSLSF